MLSFLQSWGLLGLFVGSFLAATVIPFSSDALLVGMLVAGVSPLPCLLWATLGNWLGGLTSFAIGWMGKWEWIERWFRVSRETLEKQRVRVERWGVWLALFTWLPIVGDVFAIALGFYRCPVVKSAVFMLLGKALRFSIWTVLFYCVGGV
ncbi:MAG: DedA family protein [Bacteroidales bacterium]|nr:DedA family protein [Bacteroidales bacterium]